MTVKDIRTIGILGGTGKEGKGLAYRWAKSGHQIIIGSRSVEKARNTAQELSAILSADCSIIGESNLQAAQHASIVALTVPYSAHRETLLSVKEVLKNKLLIDVTVPLVPPRVGTVQMPPAGSAAQEACEILGNEVQVTTAFQNLSHKNMISNESTDCDVLVTGTTREARQITLELVADAGLIGWDAGPIDNSVVVEGLTSVLIGINKLYGSTSAGIRITGVRLPISRK